jgi:hypothetical protein
MEYVPPILWYLPTPLRNVISKNLVNSMVTAVSNSNLTYLEINHLGVISADGI